MTSKDMDDDGNKTIDKPHLLVLRSIERDSKGVYTVPAFELKSGSKSNETLLPTDWKGIMRGLQQVHCSLCFSMRPVDADIQSRASCSQF